MGHYPFIALLKWYCKSCKGCLKWSENFQYKHFNWYKIHLLTPCLLFFVVRELQRYCLPSVNSLCSFQSWRWLAIILFISNLSGLRTTPFIIMWNRKLFIRNRHIDKNYTTLSQELIISQPLDRSKPNIGQRASTLFPNSCTCSSVSAP